MAYKRKINIFLGSSILEFEKERILIENFIRNISDKFEEHYDIKLQPLLCENFDDAVSVVRKQEEYNQKVKNSEFCFFIFFTKAGQFTKEEFDVAMAQFKETGKPKIYTYFKVIEEGAGEESLYAFMDELDKTLGHYYGTFEHVDTVKLRILLSLKLEEMDFLEIKTEGGKCVVDGKEVMDLKNVTEFVNNKELARLHEELKGIETEYFTLKADFEKDQNDQKLFDRYYKIASQRKNLIDQIEELEKLIFKVSVRLVKDSTHGEITLRQKEAYRRFELGDYEGCMSVLDSSEMDSEFERRRKRRKEEDLADCRRYIREYKTKIEILSAMTKYEGRFEEITACYEKISSLALEEKIELDVVYNFIYYLFAQNKNPIELMEKLEKVYECEGAATDEDKAKLLMLMGMVYSAQDVISKTEIYHKKSIALCEALAKKNPERYSVFLANCYNNAGFFYNNQGQVETASECYKKAISIFEKLVEEKPKVYSFSLANCYNSTGMLYNYRGNFSKADRYYKKAIEILEPLSVENFELFGFSLATVYSNMGMCYASMEKPRKSEGCYKKSIELYEGLLPLNPDRVKPFLANGYNGLATFYSLNGKIEKATEYFNKTIEIYEVLAKEQPRLFNANLANCYNNVGFFYGNMKQVEKAVEYYEKAIAIFEALSNVNIDRFAGNLAMSSFNLAILTNDEELFVKACDLAYDYPEHPMSKHVIDTLEAIDELEDSCDEE
jgi:tetratricopeptide (TPR) repeat protein